MTQLHTAHLANKFSVDTVVSTQCHTSPPPTCTGLLGYLTLDETSGQAAIIVIVIVMVIVRWTSGWTTTQLLTAHDHDQSG